MKDTIAAFLDAPSDFNQTALALFAWQRANNPDYAAICDKTSPRRWQEIPAAPVALFRDLPLTCFPHTQATTIFRTSGTTGRRGVVHLADTALYDHGARTWAERCLGPLPAAGISLVSQAADSSLGHMCARFVPGMPTFFDPATGVQTEAAWAALRGARAPVFVPGTAFAFADLLAAAPDTICPLPAGSIVMVTGGFKGRRRALSAVELNEALRRAFPTARLVGEYGMSELSSQLWSVPLGGDFQAPPWMRVLAVDPLTGEPARQGVLRFFDLANHQTVLAVETRDVGIVHPGNRITLLGRLPGSPHRGCSLTVEEASAPPVMAAGTPLPRFEHFTDVAPTTHSHDLPATPPRAAGRISQVLDALGGLHLQSIVPLAQGLAEASAHAGLSAALSAITAGSLSEALQGAPEPAERVSLVCAQGVFTAAVEWVSMAAAAGCRVHIKPPSADPDFLYALADSFAAAGLPVSASTARDLDHPDVIIAFGDDETLEALAVQWPSARLIGFGHRFSVVWSVGRTMPGIAWDTAMFDTRGCMAPAALFTSAEPEGFAASMAEQLAMMQRALPRGKVDPALGPEWRRRLALGRARGTVYGGEDWAVVVLPPAYFTPLALPRLLTIHPVDDSAAFREVLRPWRSALSTLCTDDYQWPGGDPAMLETQQWFPRICYPGTMQSPRFPRRHDGVDMIATLLKETTR